MCVEEKISTQPLPGYSIVPSLLCFPPKPVFASSLPSRKSMLCFVSCFKGLRQNNLHLKQSHCQIGILSSRRVSLCLFASCRLEEGKRTTMSGTKSRDENIANDCFSCTLSIYLFFLRLRVLRHLRPSRHRPSLKNHSSRMGCHPSATVLFLWRVFFYRTKASSYLHQLPI